MTRLSRVVMNSRPRAAIRPSHAGGASSLMSNSFLPSAGETAHSRPPLSLHAMAVEDRLDKARIVQWAGTIGGRSDW